MSDKCVIWPAEDSWPGPEVEIDDLIGSGVWNQTNGVQWYTATHWNTWPSERTEMSETYNNQFHVHGPMAVIDPDTRLPSKRRYYKKLARKAVAQYGKLPNKWKQLLIKYESNYLRANNNSDAHIYGRPKATLRIHYDENHNPISIAVDYPLDLE